MKKIIFLCLFLALAASMLHAQEQSKPADTGPETAQTQSPQKFAPDMELFTQAYGLGLEGKYKEALNKFREMETRYPQTMYLDRAIFWQAWCHTELKNFGVAIRTYEKLVEKFPKSAYVDDALFKMGEIYENYQHDYEMAMQTYERLIKLFPGPGSAGNLNSNVGNNVVSAQQNRAQIEEQQNANPQQALNEWQKSQAMNQGFRGGRRTIKNDDYFTRRAQGRIDFIKTNSDNEYLALTALKEGQALAKESKFDEAIAKFRELVRDYPNSSLTDDATLEIVKCQKQKGEAAKAMETLRNFVQTYPKSELLPEARQLEQQMNKEPRPVGNGK